MWFVYTGFCNRLSFRDKHGAHWVKVIIALEDLTLNPWQRNLMEWRERRSDGSIWRHLRIIMSHWLRCRPSCGLEYFFWNVWSMSTGRLMNIWTMDGGDTAQHRSPWIACWPNHDWEIKLRYQDLTTNIDFIARSLRTLTSSLWACLTSGFVLLALSQHLWNVDSVWVEKELFTSWLFSNQSVTRPSSLNCSG